MAIKQYAIFVLPFAVLLDERPTVRRLAALALKAVLVAALVTIPAALWNPHAFFDSVVAFQARQPFRPDALSYLAWSAPQGIPRLPLSTGFLILIPTLALVLVRAPRTASGFAAGSAILFLGFFSFAKQAFCNYYMLVVGALCCAAASARIGAP